MPTILSCLGLFCALACPAIEANVIFTQMMTPKWLYKNAEIAEGAFGNYTASHLTLRSLGKLRSILSLPLPSIKTVPGDLIFRLEISVQKPTGDSDCSIGVGNKNGVIAIVQIADNRPFFGNALGTVNTTNLTKTVAEANGSTKISNPFDEDVIFEYKPSENFASYYGGGQKVTGTLWNGPDINQDLYLIIIGDDPGEEYKIQSIRMEIENV